jgi:hypothetical protein
VSEPQLAPVFVSRHAVERYQKRHRLSHGTEVRVPEATAQILELLARADPYEPENATQFWHMERRIHRERGQGREVEFWHADGWRFVLCRRAADAHRVLVTCERIVAEEN